MALKSPVYTPKEGGKLHATFELSKIAKDDFFNAFHDFVEKNPKLKDIAIFSIDDIGYEEGNTYDIEKYEKELKVRPYHGHRVFRKNSKTLKLIQHELGEFIEKRKNANNYKYYLTDYFDYEGRTSFNTQTIGGKLYFSAGIEAKEHEDIELVDDAKYLRALADAYERLKEVEKL